FRLVLLSSVIWYSLATRLHTYCLLFVFNLPVHQFSFFFFFNDPATTEIYTFPTRRSSDLLPGLPCRHRTPRHPGPPAGHQSRRRDRKSTRLNSSHGSISYAVFCLKKKKTEIQQLCNAYAPNTERRTEYYA